MPLDARFVTGVELEELFRDKDTGEPLAFGTVEFFQDDNRVVPKLVYTLQNAANPPTPPNYGYVALPNPITLSAVGTISDNNGNNVPIYYFPFDGTPVLSNDTIQLYYVVIRNAAGVVQFTREAWPNTTDEDNPVGQEANISNQLSNPQFVDVNFLPNNPSVLPLTGAATTTIAIAPRWDLIVTHTATTTITVLRTAVQGVSAYPGNPPFTLTITPGLNINAVSLRQRLDNNPDIFGRAAGGANGYVSASVLLAPASNLTISYQPNGQPAQILLAANNLGGAYAEFNNTVQLAAAANPSTGDTGFVDIILTLPIVGATTFSNLQIVGLASNIQNVGYDQVTANREKDQLFNYYNPLLQYKPIPSYLEGWNFQYNPTQALGAVVAASAAGANTSRYVWDQTIIFQSANNGPAASRSAQGGLVIQSTNTTQFALIQYLPRSKAAKILNDDFSCMVSALTNIGITLAGKISIYFTTDAALPDITAGASIVATLDATGKPATFNGNWTEITRNGLGDAAFVVSGNGAGSFYNNYGFSGWNAFPISPLAANTATFFAIVVGFASQVAAQAINFGSISLTPGKIPTIPGPKSMTEYLEECLFYYQKSFAGATVPAQNVAVGPTAVAVTSPGATNNVIPVTLQVPMRRTPTIVTYSPGAASAEVYNLTAGTHTATAVVVNNEKSFYVTSTGNAGGVVTQVQAINWTADARLGVP